MDHSLQTMLEIYAEAEEEMGNELGRTFEDVMDAGFIRVEPNEVVGQTWQDQLHVTLENAEKVYEKPLELVIDTFGYDEVVFMGVDDVNTALIAASELLAKKGAYWDAPLFCHFISPRRSHHM